MAIILNDNVDTRAPKPIDSRFGPYTTTAAALADIPEYQRYIGLTVGVGTPIKEYWFTSISTLEEKKSSGNIGGISAGTGIDISGTETLTISVTSPTQLTTNISTDVITDQASDTKYPSVKATKAYVDNNVAGLLDDRGNFAATSGNYPTTGGSGTGGAIKKGDLWFISVAGTLGTVAVQIGASVRALKDDAGATTDSDWDVLDTGLGYTPENVNNKVTSGSSITSDPTSTSKYASLKALTEYLESIPASTPTLQQVLAATPTQTSIGYYINLNNTGENLTTKIGQGEVSLTNTTSGDGMAALPASVTISSTGKKIVFTPDNITFTSSSNKTLQITAVTENNTITLPNQTATLVASVNNAIFADASTGNINIPYVGGSGTQNYVTKWSSTGSTLVDSQIFDNGSNVGIGTATPGYKLDVTGTGRFTNTLYADTDIYVNNYFAINTTATAFPIPNGTLGIWRQKGNGFGTKFLEDEQGGAKDKWAFVKREGYNELRDWYQTNSSIVNINYGWSNPNSSNYEAATLLIDPTINITNALNTGTIVRGIYYNPTETSIVNTKHIAFENTKGNNYLNSTSGFTAIKHPATYSNPYNFDLDVNGKARIGNLSITTSTNAGDISGSGIRVAGVDNTFQFQGSAANGITMFTFSPWNSDTAKTSLTNTDAGIIKVNGGFQNPNIANLSGNVLWLTPSYDFPVTIPPNPTGTKVRGIYYNPSVGVMTNTTHIAFENTSGDNYFNSGSGKTTFFGQDLQIEKNPSGYIGFSRIYPQTPLMIGGLTTHSDTLRAHITLGVVGGNVMGANTVLIRNLLGDVSQSASGTYTNTQISGRVLSVSGSPEHRFLHINPSYDDNGQPNSYTGTIRGLYYKLTESTAFPAGAKNIAFENVNGNVLLGTESGRVGIATASPNTSTKLDVNGSCHFGTGTPSTFIGGLHTVEITASGSSAPLTTIGGTSIIEIWSDSTKSNGAVSYGASFPGSTPDGNIHFATFQTGDQSWRDRIIVEKNEGRVRIGAGSSTAVASALLEISSTTKGFLPPRMTTAEMNAIVDPEEGLVIFNTSVSTLAVYASKAWNKISMTTF